MSPTKDHGNDNYLQRQIETLHIIQQTLGYNHPNAAEVFIAMGLFHHHVANSQDEAIRNFKNALEILDHQARTVTNESDPKHKAILMKKGVILTDIGNACEKMGYLDKSVRSHWQALSIFQSNCELDGHHPRVIATLRCYNRVSSQRHRSNGC